MAPINPMATKTDISDVFFQFRNDGDNSAALEDEEVFEAEKIIGEALPIEQLETYCPENGMILANWSAIGMDKMLDEHLFPRRILDLCICKKGDYGSQRQMLALTNYIWWRLPESKLVAVWKNTDAVVVRLLHEVLQLPRQST
ncbi:hypothetical protein Tco_1402666 [Tanacetum coccineum]